MPRRFKHQATSTLRRQVDSIFNSLKTSDGEILTQCGLDAYSFIRLLRLTLQLYLAIAIIIIPVLLQLNFIDGKDSFLGEEGLDRLSIANVGEKSSKF